jgi:hypothetical protein
MDTNTIDLNNYINMFGFFSISGFNLGAIWTVSDVIRMCDE